MAGRNILRFCIQAKTNMAKKGLVWHYVGMENQQECSHPLRIFGRIIY